jgi:hypothetical protein
MKIKDVTQKYFAGIIRDWNPDSYSPLIELTEVKGDIDNIELNCEILLDVHEVFNEEFTKETMLEMEEFHKLVVNGVYQIPEQEKLKRKE